MEKEKAKIRGYFKIAVLDSAGEVKELREGPNTIMNLGIAEVTALMLTDVGGVAFDYLAIGTGTDAPNATDTSMYAETYRQAGTGSQVTDAIESDSARLTTSVAITDSGDITEVGIFNSSSTGVMLARTTFSAVSTSNGDTVNLGYDVILS